MVLATTLRKTRFDEVALVEVHGTLDIATTPRLRTMLLGGLSNGAGRLIVDLSRAKMIDCSAIGVFFSVREHAEQQRGTLRAVAAQDMVRQVLEVTGVAKTLGAYDSVEQALAGTDVDGTGGDETAEDAAQILLRVMGHLPPDAPGRSELRAEAIELSLPLATGLARRFHDRGEPREDLDQVATVGLVKAVDGYDAGTDREGDRHFPDARLAPARVLAGPAAQSDRGRVIEEE